jgi:hypothetical protein
MSEMERVVEFVQKESRKVDPYRCGREVNFLGGKDPGPQ